MTAKLDHLLKDSEDNTLLVVWGGDDGEIPVHNLQSLTGLPSRFKIIAMDIFVAAGLKNSAIPFKTLFDYAKDVNYSGIYQKAVEASLEWFVDPSTGEDVTHYDGISFGELFQWEMIYAFAEYFRYSVEINSLIDKERPPSIILIKIGSRNAGHFEILKETFIHITQKSKIKFNVFEIINPSVLTGLAGLKKYFDVQKVNVTLFNFSVAITLPAAILNLLQNIFFSIQCMIQRKNEIKMNNGSRKKILFAGPEVISYTLNMEFLNKYLTHDSYWCYLLGSGLNLTGVANFKNIILENWMDEGLTRSLKDGTSFFKNKLQVFLNQRNHVPESQHGRELGANSILPAVLFEFLFTKRFPGLLKDILAIKKLFKSTKIDLILTHADTTPFEKMVVLTGKSVGVPSLVVQHGVTGQYSGFHPVSASKILVWGKHSRDFILKHENNKKRVVVTGNPVYDAVQKKNGCSRGKDTAKGNNFLYSFEGISRFLSQPEVNPAPEIFISMLKALVGLMRHFPDRKLVVLAKPVERKNSLVQFLRNDSLPDNFEICYSRITEDILADSEIFFTTYSTVGIEALLMSKPVIQMNFSPRRYETKYVERDGVPYAEYGAALKVTRPEDLMPAINKVLYDDGVKKSLASGRERFLRDYCHKPDGMAGARVKKVMDAAIKGRWLK